MWLAHDPKAARLVPSGVAGLRRSMLLRTAGPVVDTVRGEQWWVREQRAARARAAAEGEHQTGRDVAEASRDSAVYRA